MKKHIFILLILTLLLLFPANAFAEDTDVLFNDFTAWVGDVPYEWEFESLNGSIEQGDGEVELALDDLGYSLISTTLTLEPSSAYRITVPVDFYDVSSDSIGANVNIQHQYADDGYYCGTGSATLELYVETNVDAEQLYTLRIGLGTEDSYAAGSMTVDSVTVTRLDELPEDAYAYTLIGSIGLDGYEEETSAEDEDNSGDSVASYNTAGVVLVWMLFSLLLAVFFTSKWAKRFSDRISSAPVMLAIFLIAFLVRVYVCTKSEGHITDLNCFKAWAINLQTYGLSGFYESGIFADYMPGYYYILYPIGFIYNLLGLDYNSVFYKFIVELVPILCDLGIAYFAYRIVRKKQGERIAALAAVFFLFVPFSITNSVVWGQIDSVFTIALVGTVYLLYKDKKLLSCLLWTIALMIKPQALLLAPVIAIVFLCDLFSRAAWKRTLIDAGISIACIAAAILLLSLPMKGGQSLTYIIDRLINTTGQYAYGTVNAFNFFGLLGGNFITDTEPLIFGISYRTFGWVFILLITLLAGIFYAKSRKKENLFLVSGLYLLLIYLFAHNMHERYIYPAIVLLAIDAFLRNDRRLLFSSAALSAVFFANMYIVLEFRQEFIYSWITALFSALYLAAALFTVYSARKALVQGDALPILSDPFEKIPSFASARRDAALLRLKSAPHVDRRMKGKDWLIMLLITAVYSVIMLTNLGSTVIPESAVSLPEDDADPIIIELSDEHYIGELKYYTGYCGGSFIISTSVDGESYYEAYCGEINHEHADMFRWQMASLDTSAKYIMLEKTSGYLDLREVAFFDENNVRIDSVSRAYRFSTGENASAVIDEQTQAPSATSYMTEMYFDEVYHARTAYEYINGIYPYEITHPPLGKAFIALGILLFGMNPFGWRFAGAVAGILMIPVLYIFAKRIFRKTKWAALSAILFAADFMHYSLSRIATIDSFTLLFILLMYLCMYEYTQHNFLNEKLSRTLLPLGLCGLFFGLGAATKWISLYAGLGLAIIFFYTVYQRTQEYRTLKENNDARAAAFAKKLILTLLFCICVFIILPVTIYCVSYLPYEWTAEESFGLRGILDNQSYMFNYHGYLSTDDPHPYSSVWQTWPFSIRPVFFFLASGLDVSKTALIWCMGNPLLWWSGIAAFMFIAGKRDITGKIDLRGIGFLLLAAFCQLAPNLLITREMFLYHYFTLIPFMCIGIVYVLRYISEQYKYGSKISYAFVAVVILLFILFYPLITGTPVSYNYGKAMQWISTWPI